jgi:hypothetical protein
VITQSTPNSGTVTASSRFGDPAVPHIVVLIICIAMLAAAFIITPAKNGGTLSLVGFAMPPTCATKMTTGLSCPGCGLTRSWVAAAHGRFQESLSYHNLGWVIMLYTALQLLRHALWLVVPTLRKRLERPGRWLDRGLVVLLIGLAVNWILMISGVVHSIA